MKTTTAGHKNEQKPNSSPLLLPLGKAMLAGMGLIAMLMSVTAHGAVVVWDTPQTISGDLNVSTSGTSVKAINWTVGGTTTTVNGVAFTNVYTTGTNSVTAGSGAGALLMQTASGNWNTLTAFGGTAAPFTSLSSSYQSLMQGAIYDAAVNESGTVTIQNLSIGQAYLVQFWINDSRDFSSVVGRNNSFTAGNTSQSLDFNTTNANGGVGQFITGVFTANATTQAISITTGFVSPSTNSAVQLNAYQLRAIPEPSTFILGGFGLLALLIFRRRFRIPIRQINHFPNPPPFRDL